MMLPGATCVGADRGMVAGAGGSEAETAKALEKVWLTSSVTCHGITADNPGTSCEASSRDWP